MPISGYYPLMNWTPVTDLLPPFGTTVQACSSLAVTYHVACLSPQDGKWHLSFGDMAIQHITRWMPLPELPQGSIADSGNAVVEESPSPSRGGR